MTDTQRKQELKKSGWTQSHWAPYFSSIVAVK